MTREQKTGKVLLRKFIDFNSNISKAYWKHGVKYGDYFDLRIYNNVKITFNVTTDNHNKRKEGEKRNDSLSRARQNIYRLVHANSYAHGRYKPVFTTYTFAQPVESIVDANYAFKYYIRRLNKHLGTKIKYIVVPEIQKERERKSGFAVWHFHAVLFNLPFINPVLHEQLWGQGWCDIETVHSVNDIGAYIAKYLSKDVMEKRLYGKKVYYTSRGLLRPVDVFHIPDIDNLVEHGTIINRFEGKNYTQIKYKLTKI